MNGMHYVGLDIHKKTISWCVRQADGSIMQEGRIAATRQALDSWMHCFHSPGWRAWKQPCSADGSMTTWYPVARRLR
jgi:hypothetical protein